VVNSIVLSSSRAHSQFAYKDPRIVRNRNQPVQEYEVLVQLFKSESVFGIFSPHLAVGGASRVYLDRNGLKSGLLYSNTLI